MFLMFLLNNLNYEASYQRNYWILLSFFFDHCSLETFNFQYFDKIVNMALILLVKSIKSYKEEPLFRVLNKILSFEIKKEIEIPNLEKNLQECFNEDFFTRE